LDGQGRFQLALLIPLRRKGQHCREEAAEEEQMVTGHPVK
jgi:hypothetical protein